MCVVSAVGDAAGRDFPNRWPTYFPPTQPYGPGSVIVPNLHGDVDQIKRDMAQMRKELDEIHEALRKAKEEDEAAGTPDCTNGEKVKAIRLIADALGVDLSDVLGGPA